MQRRVVEWWCRTSQGDLVTYQRPNAVLVIWLVLWLLSSVMMSWYPAPADVFMWLTRIAALYWGFLELFYGVNRLRRLLGVVVVGGVAWSVLSISL